MPANPPENMPRITPYLYYRDVAEALEWLARAFGFQERMRMPGPEGGILHAEMESAATPCYTVARNGCDPFANPQLRGVPELAISAVVDGHFNFDCHGLPRNIRRAAPTENGTE